MSARRRNKKEARRWARMASEWYELAQLRGASLQRVWMMLEAYPDNQLATEIRLAIVGETLFTIGVDDECIGAVLPEMPDGTEAD